MVRCCDGAVVRWWRDAVVRWCGGGVLRCCGAAAHVAHAIDGEAQGDTRHREDIDRRRAETRDGARVEGGHRRDDGDRRACLEGAAQLAWLGLGLGLGLG